jgi:N-acetylneuraminic acid mutarotase
MPTPRGSFMAVSDGRLIYVLGGSTVDAPQSTLDTVEIFDPGTGEWHKGANMPQPRSSGFAAAVNGFIYLAGGFYAGESVLVHRYDPTKDLWEALAPMPSPRYQGDGAQVINNQIWLVGGWYTMQRGKALPSDQIQIYDVLSDSWTESH